MSRPGFVPKNHPHQVIGRARELAAVPDPPSVDDAGAAPRSGFPVRAPNKRGVDDDVDDRETPPCVYVPLDAEFRFTLDVAASEFNAKCNRHCRLDGFYIGAVKTTEQHGLVKPWVGERVFCNPPFSGLRPWVERAWDEGAEVAVLLLPNNRSEQPFWQQCIEPYRDRPGSIVTTRNLPKRRPFLHHGSVIGNRTSKSPPFGLTIVIWDRRRPPRA